MSKHYNQPPITPATQGLEANLTPEERACVDNLTPKQIAYVISRQPHAIQSRLGWFSFPMTNADAIAIKSYTRRMEKLRQEEARKGIYL